MKHRDKLADILVAKGLVTDAQVIQALVRQKARGGRIGSHLLFYRHVTERQLVDALSEQKSVPGITLEGRTIPEDALRRLPAAIADEFLILPFKFEPARQVLHVAMADPATGAGISSARRAARANDLKVYVAVDSVLRGLISKHYHGRRRELFLDQTIELPSLFAEDEHRPTMDAAPAPSTRSQRLLVIGRTAFLKNYLVPILEREGLQLEMLSDAEEIAHGLRSGGYEHILLSKEMEDQFAEWVRDGKVPTPRTELSVFSSVSSSLLDNPAPYKALVGSLLRSLQQMAEMRCTASGWKPPYALICDDLRSLAEALGFRRLAADGLQVAAHLLVPAADATHPLAFTDFDGSLEIAQGIRFPWDVEACLVSLSHLVDEVAAAPEKSHKVSLAAQILALVWYRHAACRGREVPLATLKAELRRQASRLAAAAVIETYLRLLERSVDTAGAARHEPVLLLGEQSELAQQISVALKYGGYHVLETDALDEAKRVIARVGPLALVIDHRQFQERGVELCRFAKQANGAVVFAYSSVDKPSLVIDLLDAGFDDAYVAPFNPNLLVTRLGKALEMHAGHKSAATAAGFSGTLQDLPFVDLVQALANSRRSVRIDLQSPSGEQASIYLRDGHISHAVCGPSQGPAAIYRVIAWRDAGTFVTAPITSFPADNIGDPTHSLILEGVRQLDEAPS